MDVDEPWPLQTTRLCSVQLGSAERFGFGDDPHGEGIKYSLPLTRTLLRLPPFLFPIKINVCVGSSIDALRGHGALRALPRHNTAVRYSNASQSSLGERERVPRTWMSYSLLHFAKGYYRYFGG